MVQIGPPVFRGGDEAGVGVRDECEGMPAWWDRGVTVLCMR